MKSNKIIIISILLVAGCWLLVAGFSLAEEVDPNLVSQRRAQLEKELADLESQIESYRGVIQEKQRESTTLERDLAIFTAKIDKSKLEIKARDIRISQLNTGIGEKVTYIGFLTNKTDKEKNSLSELIRRADEMDATTIIEMVLGYDKLSDFFVDVDSFDSIYRNIQDSFQDIKISKDVTQKEKDDLESKKAEELQLKTMQELEKKRLEENEKEKKRILQITKGEEKKYQEILTARQKDAARIRTELFALRGTAAIPFEKALEYANLAFKTTGVRPAFLLGVIAEESNLGENVGSCTWDSSLAHSNCTKQRTAFIDITSRLGLDPDKIPLSCKAWYGYCGGAMGPAQFMPTTWQLYEGLVSNITGHNPPNPWDPQDAFVASALLLKDNGAAAGGYTAERRAALKYLAGSNWSNPAYSFYGDDVMELAVKYQGMIDILNQ
ncbi:MAG: lytic murein transglycosylase [Patescibacteria group bacterium]